MEGFDRKKKKTCFPQNKRESRGIFVVRKLRLIRKKEITFARYKWRPKRKKFADIWNDRFVGILSYIVHVLSSE